jgi:hypothetical protein
MPRLAGDPWRHLQRDRIAAGQQVLHDPPAAFTDLPPLRWPDRGCDGAPIFTSGLISFRCFACPSWRGSRSKSRLSLFLQLLRRGNTIAIPIDGGTSGCYCKEIDGLAAQGVRYLTFIGEIFLL